MYVSAKKRGEGISEIFWLKIRERHDFVRLCHEFFFVLISDENSKDLQNTGEYLFL